MKYALLAVAALCGSPLMFAPHKGGLSGSSSAAKKSAAKKSGAKQPSAQNEPAPNAPKLDEPKGDGAATHNSQADAADNRNAVTGASKSPQIEQTRPAVNPTETRDAITQDKPETQQSRATAHSGSGIGNKDMAAVPPANPDKANQKALDRARKDSAKNSPYNKAP